VQVVIGRRLVFFVTCLDPPLFMLEKSTVYSKHTEKQQDRKNVKS